ncbi:hypothetical protein FIBSPDRAFT_1051146 [Athelia psychrophila]|uniref:DUF7704 domain-containing protein n=1 Tax=Athelia psychrophila TaxID=1759441 RepID=A0A165ZNP2_9AGAM|nr:hypothetical protein FIBSPDRAFT_1051146 [Fibularhizoctonia sp. CBS 109695]
MSSTMPSFYRIWFTVVDPLLSIAGVLGNLFVPTTILNSYSPSFVSPPATETIYLLDATAGFLAGLVLLQVVLLRARPTDVTVWRVLQASMLLVDLAMLGGFARALSAQGRTVWRVWRAEEWTNLVIIAGVAVIRTAFVLGVGMGGQRKGKTV